MQRLIVGGLSEREVMEKILLEMFPRTSKDKYMSVMCNSTRPSVT